MKTEELLIGAALLWFMFGRSSSSSSSGPALDGSGFSLPPNLSLGNYQLQRNDLTQMDIRRHTL